MGFATGLLIAGLATKAVTSAVAAKKASTAAKEIGKIQADASATGRADVTEAKRRSDALIDPYVVQGRKATASLGRLVTPGPGAKFAAPDPGQVPARPAPSMPGGRPRPPGAPTTGQAVPRTLGGMAPGAAAPPQGAPTAMVMLEANDGSGARPVPASEAQRFMSTGKFRRVG